MHEVDNRVVRQIVTAIAERFPILFEGAIRLHEIMRVPEDFSAIWMAWVEEFDGRTAADWYVDAAGWSLARGPAEWIDAQRASSISVWQVRDLEHGRLTLVDQLTGDERVVHEMALTEVASVGLCLLARVVDHRGVSLLAGCHPHPLRPLHGSHVVEAVKRKLRRRTHVPRERLRDLKIANTMLAEWTLAMLRDLQAPDLRTGDGDGVLFTTDRWTFDPADRAAIATILAGLPDARRPPDDAGLNQIAFVREADDTMIGALHFDESSFELTTLSLARADLLRERIENACGDRIHRGLRSHDDPMHGLDEMWRHRSEEGGARTHTGLKDDGEIEFSRRYKEDHYTRWLDEPVPALGDRTPREAAKTAAGRRLLIPLLDDMTYLESRLPDEERFDFDRLREELGVGRTK